MPIDSRATFFEFRFYFKGLFHFIQPRKNVPTFYPMLFKKYINKFST